MRTSAWQKNPTSEGASQSLGRRQASPVRGGIFVESAEEESQSSVRSDIIRQCRRIHLSGRIIPDDAAPDGAWDSEPWGFYKDVAPTALSNATRSRISRSTVGASSVSHRSQNDSEAPPGATSSGSRRRLGFPQNRDRHRRIARAGQLNRWQYGCVMTTNSTSTRESSVDTVPPAASRAGWPAIELGKIAAADDLHIAPFREDGVTYGTPTWIWSVAVAGNLYVRAYNGRNSRWYQAALRQKAGRIMAAGITKEVSFEPVAGAINDQIDNAYRAKYRGSPYLNPMISAAARAATIRVVPRIEP